MKNKMNIKMKRNLVLIGIMIILLGISFISAASYSRSTPQYSPYMSSADYLARQGIGLTPEWDGSKCEAGQDFLLQISPTGCTPSVVPAGMLDDQNYAIFCPITATNVNPLIDVEAIERLQFSIKGKKPEGLSGVGFHPARAAISTGNTLLNSPILENVGYAVIVLEQQKDKAAAPKYVEGNLSVKIQYDIKNAFGIGKTTYYLPEMDDTEWTNLWTESRDEFGFFQNKFMLRAESIGLNDAIVGIYTGEDQRTSRVNLQRGKTSDLIYLPGFYCKAGVRLKLESLDNPGTRVRLKIDDNEVIEVIKGERFLDNRCTVKSITSEKVKVTCSADNKAETIYLSRSASDSLEGDSNEYYNKAMQYYEEVITNYPDKKLFDGFTKIGDEETYFGEKAISDAWGLANNWEDKKKFSDLDSEVYLSDDQVQDTKDSRMIKINGAYRIISLLKVVETNFEDYGVEVSVSNEELKLKKDEKQEVDGISVKLLTLGNDYARLEVKEGKTTQRINIDEGESKEFEGIKIRVNKINIEKVAKIKVIPEINNAKTESDIHFKIGIEEDKDLIKLSPEKIKEMIENLNKEIEDWTETAENLGKTVKGLKGACLGAGAVLTIKNIFSGFGGEAIARDYTMRGIDGDGGIVNNYCKERVGADKEFKTLPQCLSNKETIEKRNEVEKINQQIIDEQNSRFSVYTDACPMKGTSAIEIIGEKSVDDDCFCKEQIKYLTSTYSEFSGLEDKHCDRISPRTLRKLELYKLSSEHSNEIVSKGAEGEITKLYSEITTGISFEGDVEFTEASIREEDLVVKYMQSAPNENVPAIVPFRIDTGWYVGVREVLTESAYKSGAPKIFYICNVGSDGSVDFVPETGASGGDDCTSFSSGQNIAIANKTTAQTNKLHNEAINAYNEAFAGYKDGISSITINNKNMRVENVPNIPQTQCQDFMSPSDCKILFNVCDPVVCPSSRCNFGGTYYLDNVIQSGIAGSAFACLPNFVGFGGDVVIPVCLSGIHAGVEGWNSILKAHRDCLEFKLETGENIGICDEIYSIQTCDFFWKQAAPFADLVIPKLLEGATGQFTRGGGEYRGVQSAWDNAEKSVDYFTQTYATNAFAMFKSKSITDVGSEMCRNFISMDAPSGKSFLDALTEPTTPPQFHGWLDSSFLNGITVPPTHQYSVFYHIYAGTEKDEVDYAVYLRNTNGRTIQVPESRGKITKGGYKTLKKDFTAEEGYNELCIVVGIQEECGFSKVTTSFALDYVQDQYIEQIGQEQNIDSESACISGTRSAYEFVNPSVQKSAEGFIDPNIRKKGITRICATRNPGGTNSKKWREVGNCGDVQLRCWLEEQSIKEAVNLDRVVDRGIESEYERIEKDFVNTYMGSSEYEANVSGFLDKIGSNNEDKLIEVIEDIEDIENGNGVKQVFYEHEKAGLLYLKAKAYAGLAKLNINEEESKKDAETAATDTSSDEVEETNDDVVEEEIEEENRENNQVNLVDGLTQNSLNEIIQQSNYKSCDLYVNDIIRFSDNNKVNPLLVLSIMIQESSCTNHEVHKDEKSVGLMGISSWRDCQSELELDSKDDLIGKNNAAKNIQCGTIILSNKHNLYDDGNRLFECDGKKIRYYNWEAALRGYNGFGCTGDNDYVENVLNIHDELKKLSGLITTPS